MNYNRSVRVGRITRDAESGGPEGKKWARFGLAVNRSYKNSEGKRPVDFFEVVTFGDGFSKMVAESGKKGRLVLVEGEDRSQERINEATGKKEKQWSFHADNIRWLDYLERTNTQSSVTEPPVFNESDFHVDEEDLPF